METRKRKFPYRLMVQVIFFLLVAIISLNRYLSESGIVIPLISVASLHAICPFGGVVSIYEFLTSGGFVQKIHESSFILMMAAFFLAVGFGPLICGWVCPFGSVQEWTGKIGKKIFGKKYNHFVPKKMDSVLRYMRYLVLAVVIYATATTAKLTFQDYDPYYALFNIWSSEVAVMALGLLILTMILSLVMERPWCKYLCPYGAILGLFNLFRIFKIRRENSTCIHCKACDKACPMNITVSESNVVRDHQCISCMKCTSESSCPVDSTVTLSTKRWNSRYMAIALMILIVIFGSFLITSALGTWQTTSSKEPERYDTGTAMEYNPADIRGSYTFADIEKAFDIPLEDLQYAFGLQEVTDIESFKCKDLEAVYGYLAEEGTEIGTDSMRHFVALYKGLPFTLVDTTYILEPAAELLREKGTLSEEQLAFVESHTVK